MRDTGAVGWRVAREGELAATDHAALAALLRAAFPLYAHAYPGRRSWSGARPEARAIGYDRAGPAAHAGILRRFIQIGAGPQVEQLVGVVGMVAVRPDLHGTGLGRELGARTAALLAELAVPYGLLGCAPGLVGYYLAIGWHQLPPVRSIYCPLDVDGPYEVVSEVEDTMLLPVRGALGDWPAGDLHWNGAPV